MSSVTSDSQNGDQRGGRQPQHAATPEKEGRQRKPRRPDREVYRPPAAKGESGKGGGGDAISAKNAGEKTVSKEDRLQQWTHSLEKRQHGAKESGTMRDWRIQEDEPAAASAPARTRQLVVTRSNSGRQFLHEQPFSGKNRSLGSKSASIDFHSSNTSLGPGQKSGTGGHPSETARRNFRQEWHAAGGNTAKPEPGSKEMHSSHIRSSMNGGSESTYRAKRTREFTRTGSDISDTLSLPEWKLTAEEIFRKPNEPNIENTSARDVSHSSAADRPVSQCKTDPSSSRNTPPVLTEPTQPLQPIADLNRSWVEIMEEEQRAERARASVEGAPASPFPARGVPAVSDSANKRSMGRGGLIRMTAAVESAINQSERRPKTLGRGTLLRQSVPAPGNRRGGRAAPVFPQGRHVGDAPSTIRLNPHMLPDIVMSNPARGRGTVISAGAPFPPGYSDRGGASDSLLPHDLNQEIDHLENRIAYLAKVISHGNGRRLRNEVEEMLSTRKRLQEVFHEAVLINPRHEEQRTLESRMWKSAFYQPVEALRSAVQSGREQEFCKTPLLALIEEAACFYQSLIEEHETNYGFKVDNFCYHVDDKLTNILTPAPSAASSVKYSLACCQRYLVALGDLARYREQVKQTSRYGHARSFYNKAAQLAPMNGRAHNQLALLAVYTSRYLDAAFFYVRSLAAKHAFDLARTALIDLFEDIRKKVAYYESERQKELELMRKKRGSRDQRGSTRRLNQREIWKFPDGSTSDMKADDEEKQDSDDVLTKFSAQDLHKRCCAYLLRAAGILYTKIGVDCFEATAELALIQLRALLNLDESPLSATHVVQLTVIFLFLIHHTSSGETERGSIRAVQNYAILLSFSVFGLLLERLERFLHDESVMDRFSREMHVLLPAIRIFCIWMTAQDAFNLYSGLQYSVGGLDTEKFRISLWENLAKVCTIIERYKNNGKLKIWGRGSSGDAIDAVLPEDLYTTAFFDIFPSKPVSCKLPKELPSDIAAEHIRLNWLLELGSVLDGYGYEAFSIVDGHYVVPDRPDSPRAGQLRLAASDEEDASSEVTGAQGSLGEADVVGEMSQLQLLQRDLEMKKTALEREGQFRSEIIVEPYYLVVDTNSFIDHRVSIEKVVTSKHYKLTVPFVVYNELLGLEKNEDAWVSGQAKSSLQMLHDFTNPTSSFAKYVEAVTSSGRLLADFDFHKNEEAQRLSNDDLVLKCCRNLALAKEDELGKRQERRNLRSEPLTIYRKVVLLTDDKNLRLKAQGEEIPVIGIEKFVQMARLTSL